MNHQANEQTADTSVLPRPSLPQIPHTPIKQITRIQAATTSPQFPTPPTKPSAPALTIRQRLEQQYAKSQAMLLGNRAVSTTAASSAVGLGGAQYIPMRTPKNKKCDGAVHTPGTPIGIPKTTSFSNKPALGPHDPPLPFEKHVGLPTSDCKWQIFRNGTRPPDVLNNKAELLKLLQDVIPEDMVKEFDKNPWTQPKELRSSLLPHQVLGVRWMIETEKRIKGGILADDMGLGKTIQAICLIISQKPISATNQRRPTLVVAPVSLLDQWRHEILEHAGTFLSVTVHNGPKRAKVVQDLVKFDVVITNYELVGGKRDANQVLFDVDFERIILDEGHRIRNTSSNQSKCCMELKATYRWILTGTPIQNSMNEIFTYMQFLKCPAYQTKAQWTMHFDKSSDPKSSQIRLHELLKRYLLRRTKELIALPPKLLVCETLDLSSGERVFYDQVQAVVSKKAKEAQLNSGSAMIYLALLTRLRQAVLHPDLIKAENKPDFDWAVDEDDADSSLVADMSTMFGDLSLDLSVQENSADSSAQGTNRISLSKFGPLNDLPPASPLRSGTRTVQESPHVQVPIGRSRFAYESTKVLRTLKIIKSPHRLAVHLQRPKTIVFSQFTSMLAILATALKDNLIEYCLYEGSMDQKQRLGALNTFKTNPNIQVLLISLHCGSVGLNLTCASRIILFDPWWNPQIEFQAMDRVHRLGQKNPVVIHQLKVENSVEDRIFMLQEKKKVMAERALGDVERDQSFKMPSNMRLSNDELINLVIG